MASLGIHYVKNRQECKDCQWKATGLVGIASKCLGIEVHAGATHKFYHPKCFFKSSKCREVIDKLHYKTAEGMTGYKTLSHSDQMMVYSLFAYATDVGGDDEEEERIVQRKNAVANKKAKKREEATEKQKKSKPEKEESKTPMKRRRMEKKEKKKKLEESDEEEVINISSTRRQQKEKKETGPAEDSGFMDEELNDVEVSRRVIKPKSPKENESSTLEMEEDDEAPLKKPKKIPGRGKPSEKMAAMFEKVFKRKIDEQIDLDLDLDSD